MSNQSIFFFRSSVIIIIFSLLLSGCPAPVVEYPIPARRIKDQSTDYQPVHSEGQVSQKTVKELEERYPAGFHEQNQPIIPLDDQIRVSFRLFTSNPRQTNTAQMVTDAFINIFAESNIFVVIERERINQLATEHELNQSGLINQDEAPEAGQFAASDVVVTGSIDQAGGRMINARVMDVTTGRIILSERLTPAVINSQSAEMLARMLLNKMKEKYYTTE